MGSPLLSESQNTTVLIKELSMLATTIALKSDARRILKIQPLKKQYADIIKSDILQLLTLILAESKIPLKKGMNYLILTYWYGLMLSLLTVVKKLM